MTLGRVLGGVITGAAGGTSGALLGVGGGVILVTLLVRLVGLNQHRAHGTSLLTIFPISLFGVATYAFAGGFDSATEANAPAGSFVILMALLAAGSVVGVTIGARLMGRLSERRLRQVFGIFLLIVAARMFLVM